jgi:hypothetical protein
MAGFDFRKICKEGSRTMRVYVDQKPPGWNAKPGHPVIILDAGEEKIIRAPLHEFRDIGRKLWRKAERVFDRNRPVERVDVCNDAGEVIKTIQRPKRED